MKCIICEKIINDQNVIHKHDVNFCSQECVQKYEEQLKNLEKVVDWDNCC